MACDTGRIADSRTCVPDLARAPSGRRANLARGAPYDRRLVRALACILCLALIQCREGAARPAPLPRRLETEPESLNPLLVRTTDERVLAHHLFSPMLYRDRNMRL